jgi:hypothetical protein
MGYTLHLHEAGGAWAADTYPSFKAASEALVAFQKTHCLGASQVGVAHGKLLGPESVEYRIKAGRWPGK